MKIPNLLYLLVCITIMSCTSENNVFSKKINISDSGWQWQDSIVFQFEGPDTINRYDINLDILHNGTFPYENIYTKVHTIYPDNTRKTQVLSFNLSRNDGSWLGDKSIFSDQYHTTFIMQNKIIFPKPGKYGMVIEQFSRDNPMIGIKSLTLNISKSAL